MAYLVDIKEELDEQIQHQIRKFKARARGGTYTWYRIRRAIDKARDFIIYHDKIENFIMPNLFDEDGTSIDWWHWGDPESKQVRLLKKNLQRSSTHSYSRGRVSSRRLKAILKEILAYRIEQYLNPNKNMEKLKILCIVGGSGCGKTLASLHLKYKKDANVICSYTTRKPRATEVEGRDHHFIDIVADRTEMIAYAYFGGEYYYALKNQVFGPCTVYVIDEKGLKNLRQDFGDVYDITTVLIKRSKVLRRRMGVDETRIRRDERRDLKDEDYDYVIENNGSKKELFDNIECIYETVKNKQV